MPGVRTRQQKLPFVPCRVDGSLFNIEELFCITNLLTRSSTGYVSMYKRLFATYKTNRAARAPYDHIAESYNLSKFLHG
jgi:hypothetical protein